VIDATDPRLTFARFIEDAARRHGDRVAIVSADATATYAELEARITELARALVGAGIAKGARVAVWFANSPESIVATYAVCSVGAVLVPVNTFATASERDYILRHSDASALLMQPALGKQRFLEDLLASHPEIERSAPGRLRVAALPHLRRVACMGLPARRAGVESWGDLLACGRDVPDAQLEAVRGSVVPSDDGLIIYTSGTTSHPKGVLHTQRAAVIQGYRFADMLAFTPEDRVFTTYPFFWTAGIAMSIGGAFAAGARLLVQPVFEPEGALALMERERATSIHAWPHQQKAIAEHPTAAGRDLSTLTKVEVHSPIAALAGVKENLYDYGTSYGLSETFTICSATRADAPAAERRGNNGPPCPGMQLRIVDPVTGAPLGPGEEGEIAVKGVTLMRGYYKVAPEQVFDADGYYHTQDGGSIDGAGRLIWNGRLGNLIKTGGANVSPVELQEILESHPELKVGIPIGVEHPTLGEALVLCAVPLDGATPDEAEVRAWLRARVAAYKVPRRVLFFRADELAYTANQKIQVAPLKQAAVQRLREERAEIQGHRFEP
jgi:fatty-acyl-CoA synthase